MSVTDVYLDYTYHLKGILKRHTRHSTHSALILRLELQVRQLLYKHH